MSCGGRHFCPGCGQELIHRDNRKFYEAASTVGQIVNRIGPVQITCGDVDLYVLKFLHRRDLLFLVEHKQPGSPLKPGQTEVLRRLDSIIRHATTCPHYAYARDHRAVRLDTRSGVYIIRGAVHAGDDQYRTTNFQGAQTVTRTVDGSFDPGWSHELKATEKHDITEQVFRFLEGAWKATDRSGPRRDPKERR